MPWFSSNFSPFKTGLKLIRPEPTSVLRLVSTTNMYKAQQNMPFIQSDLFLCAIKFDRLLFFESVSIQKITLISPFKYRCYVIVSVVVFFKFLFFQNRSKVSQTLKFIRETYFYLNNFPFNQLLRLSITCGLQNSKLNRQIRFSLPSIKCLAAPPCFRLLTSER